MTVLTRLLNLISLAVFIVILFLIYREFWFAYSCDWIYELLMSDPDLIVFALKDVFIGKLIIQIILVIVMIIGIVVH